MQERTPSSLEKTISAQALTVLLALALVAIILAGRTAPDGSCPHRSPEKL